MTNRASWFEVIELESGIVAIHEPSHVERVTSHLVTGSERAILIDTGMGVANIREVVDNLTSLPVTVVNSHAHWDHIGGNTLFEEILIHPAEADDLSKGYPAGRLERWFAPEFLTGPLPEGVTAGSIAIAPGRATGVVNEGDTLDLGNRTLRILHTPGHSPGGIVLLDEANGVLFSTDLVYHGFLYAYQGPSLETYRQSLRRLATLAPDLRDVYPSHNETRVSPDLLPAAAELLDRIIAGEPSAETRHGMPVYGDDALGAYLIPIPGASDD